MKAEVSRIQDFIRTTLEESRHELVVLGVSGGIDSAVVLTLLAQTLNSDNIFPIAMPYADQDSTDNLEIAHWNKIPEDNIQTINIQPTVDAFSQTMNIPEDEQLRKGNVMARTRMMVLYDEAKTKRALVAGTENKSEFHLGYFTRFGDQASDFEPIAHLYKTQVRELAKYLGIPEKFLTKSPSAGLWQDQTDEAELGFSYSQADQVLAELIDNQTHPDMINLKDVPPEIVKKVIERVTGQRFKHLTPYVMQDH